MPARPRFSSPRGLERQLEARLREIARSIGAIVKAHADGKGGLDDEAGMVQALDSYSRTIRPWAGVVVRRILTQVGTTNLAALTELLPRLVPGE